MTKQYTLVVGGAGYIGSHTNKLLRHAGRSTLVLDNLSTGHAAAVAGTELIRADLGDPAGLEAVFCDHAIESVVHFAASAYVGESVIEPQKYYHNNVVGTLNLLEQMRRHGVSRLVFSSTCAVYGNPQYLPLDEAHPCSPVNPYGRSKWMVENILADYSAAYGLDYVALRYFNAAGADLEGGNGELHEPETHIIPLLLQSVVEGGKPVTVFGTDYPTPDGTCIRDFIHVQDLARAHVLALDYLLAGGGSTVVNLGTGRGHSVAELIQVVEEVTGRAPNTRMGPRRAGDPAQLVAGAGRAKAELGWEASIPDIRAVVASAWQWEQHRCWGHDGLTGTAVLAGHQDGGQHSG